MPIAKLGELGLHYIDEGRGPPVLLLHAFPLGAEAFRPQLATLSESYRVIVPDQRGFGKTPLTGSGPTTMEQLAQDAFALLSFLGIERAVVGGVSMGGYAAMAMLREDAGRVLGLMLLDTHPRADDAAGREKREENARATITRGMEFLVESMVPKLLAPSAPAEVRSKVESIIRLNRPEGAAAALRGMAERKDQREILSRYAGPLLVIVGEHDQVTPPEKVREMAELVPGATVEVIPGAGHLAHLEVPDAVNDRVGAFLARV